MWSYSTILPTDWPIKTRYYEGNVYRSTDTYFNKQTQIDVGLTIGVCGINQILE